MKVFFSAQIAGLFLATPFLISWLSRATFPYAPAAFWGAIIGAGVEYVLVTAAIYTATKKWDW